MLKVAWPTDYHGDGNSFGYSVHNDGARRALEAQGFEIDPGASVAVHVAPAHRFRPLAGRLNILYTAWESTDLTPDFREGVARADAVVVTARFLLEVIRREFPGKPCHYCPLGVDAEAFPFRERQDPTPHHQDTRSTKNLGGLGALVVKAVRRFRFLWLGAPNARKGWEVAREAWRGWARLVSMGRELPPAELYVKTSVTGRLEEIPVPGGRVVFDSRRLETSALSALYATSHAFLFPSFGEGFGLTMAEAMATGLPVLFTPWSAMTDLADESCGFPLRYRLIRHDLARTDDKPQGTQRAPRSGSPPEWYDAKPSASSVTSVARSSVVTFAQASAEDLLRRMIEVATDYRKALRKGRLAARRIRKKFTWDRTGRTLAEIVRTECARRRGNHG